MVTLGLRVCLLALRKVCSGYTLNCPAQIRVTVQSWQQDACVGLQDGSAVLGGSLGTKRSCSQNHVSSKPGFKLNVRHVSPNAQSEGMKKVTVLVTWK